METDLFNLLISSGPLGAVAAFFFWKWQQAENDLKEERAANLIRTEANHLAMINLQEKRISDVARVESVVSSNSSAMTALTQLVQGLASRGGT